MIGELHYRIRPFARLKSPSDWIWSLDHSCRKYLVRAAIDQDDPTIANDRSDAQKMGCEPYQCITIIRLRDGKKWIFGGRTVGFPYQWENTDEYAEQRIAGRGGR